MSILYLDLETRSPIDLKAYGSGAYIPNCQPILATYAVDDSPVLAWDILNDPRPGDLEPRVLPSYQCIVAHNANGFDRPICEAHLFFPEKLPWYDSQIRACAHNYPASLFKLTSFLKVKTLKFNKMNLIKIFCMPNAEGTYNTRETHPNEWLEFVEYGIIDTAAMRECWNALPSYNYPHDSFELRLVEADYAINRLGFRVDLDFVDKAIQELEKAAIEANEKVKRVTKGKATKVTQGARILKHINEDLNTGLAGVGLKHRGDLQDASDEVLELLELRDSTVKTSTAKYVKAKYGHDNERMKNTLRAYHARTGRWGGSGFQPHNLPRYDTTQNEQNLVMSAFKEDNQDLKDVLFNKSTHHILSDHLRSCIIPEDGHEFVITDYSNIEGRILAWLAKEEWKIKAFSDYDKGLGPDVYVSTFSRVFGVLLAMVTSEGRQMGKTIELACGYQGAVGALEMACKMFGLPVLETEKSVEVVKAWRKAHQGVVKLWYACQDAFVNAVQGHSTEVNAITFGKRGRDVVIKLPSGRYLVYPRAVVEQVKVEDEHGNKTVEDQIKYFYGSSFVQTYGGKIVENIIQAIGRDILACALVDLVEGGYRVPLHVHDETVVEIPKGTPDVVQQVEAVVLGSRPKWAAGMPIAVKSCKADNYRKG